MQRIEQEHTIFEYKVMPMNVQQDKGTRKRQHGSKKTNDACLIITDAHKGLPYYTRRALHAVYSRVAPCGRPLIPTSNVSIFSIIRVWGRGRNELWPLHGGCSSMVMLCILASFLLFPLTASAHTSAGSGHITGQLLDATKNNVPLAGQQVTLQAAQGASAKDVSTVTTDAHGDYSFTGLATDKTINYALYIRFQGAQYVSDLIALDTNPTQKLNLSVYEATTSTAKIAVLQDTILMHQPDVQKGVINVSEILSFRNLDSRTYVGSFDTSKGKPNTLRFSLPGSAKNVAMGTGFDGYTTAQVDLGFATDAALPPGITQFSFSYQIPYSAATYDFRYVIVYPTLQLSVLVPPTLQVDPGFMTADGITNSGDHPYRLFKSSDLITNDEIHLTLEGLSTTKTNTTTPLLNTKTIWFIVGGIILLAIIAIVGYLSSFNRRKKTAVTHKRGKGKFASSAPTLAKGAKKEVIPSTPKDKKEALLQELLSLDKAFESGKLSKAVYNDRRAKSKARLRSLLSEQEAARR